MGETGSGNVEADITSMSDYGNHILSESEGLKDLIKQVESGFDVGESGTRSGGYAMLSGLASANPTIKSALDVQDSAMSSVHALLNKFVSGEQALGNITMHMANDYNSEDVLSSVAMQDAQQEMIENVREAIKEQYGDVAPPPGHPAGPGSSQPPAPPTC